MTSNPIITLIESEELRKAVSNDADRPAKHHSHVSIKATPGLATTSKILVIISVK